MKKRICIINVFYGTQPKWFRLFLESCKANTFIDWYFFSNQKSISIKSNNIKHIELNPDEFSNLASKNLNIKVQIQDYYKICDFKPAFGKIFDEYIKEYEFWGYCDLDIIFGNLSSFITDHYLKTYDILSFYPGFLSGPFCLYRNNDQIKELFKQSVNYPEVLKSPKHYGFDENIQRPEILKISSDKIIKAIRFSLFYIFSGKFQKSSWKELRYQFQWFYKKSSINPQELSDMTEVVWFNTKQLRIKSSFNELLFSDRFFERINKTNWELKWENGNLSNKKNKKNIFAFHFVDLKQNPDWKIPENINFKNQFSITTKGIQIDQ